MIKMRKPQIGRSHMEGFTSRPGLWQFVSGGLRPKMKWNRVCRERRQEHTEMRSEYDSEATEVASGNTNEGTNPQQKHIKHTVHMSGTLTIPKQKRLVQRKVISKTSNNDGMEYRESKASKNNHQRHRLNQRAGKHFILQKPFGCCKDCIPEMNILSTQLKRFQQERKMKQHRATPFKSHKCNDPNILLITTPSLFKRINHLEKEGMIKRNCSTLTKPVKEHGCIGPKTCVSAGKRYRRFHQM
uniref:Uncharacterized protein LOC102805980 n=1 Tax=Saccoglossus kowalevskii TaxID=10224 RepID=A0ABM0MK52_SACKO|nr:PREDICTED: uncharacterized protein LOC102805980 [Saccoglossus kowalevskii]